MPSHIFNKPVNDPKPLEKLPEPETIAEEASRLVYGARTNDYGHPLDDFTKTAKIWSAILGIDVTPNQVALCMVGVKISRHLNKPKRDNLVDMVGYVLTLDRVEKRQEELVNG